MAELSAELLTLGAIGFASTLWAIGLVRTQGAIALLSQDESLWQQLQDWWKSWQGQPVLQPVPVRVRRPRRLPR
jgi:hypothetical protein